jgi:hypothetical protein
MSSDSHGNAGITTGGKPVPLVGMVVLDRKFGLVCTVTDFPFSAKAILSIVNA